MAAAAGAVFTPRPPTTLIDEWTPAFECGSVREFVVRHEPYVHADGRSFDYLLLVVRQDGGALAIRVANAGRIIELVSEFEPDVVVAGDAHCEGLVALVERKDGRTLH